MKKRLRKKLMKGEYAYPYPHTRSERLAKQQVAHAVKAIIDRIGADEFLRRLEPYNEAQPATHPEAFKPRPAQPFNGRFA